MASLKGILFNQYAGEGLSQLIEELQSKYKPIKGRRFNQNDITFEISRTVLHDNSLEFEISSKIPFKLAIKIAPEFAFSCAENGY